GAADFLHRHHVGEVPHARAAVFLLDSDAQQAQVAELLPQVFRKGVLPVDIGGARGDLGGGEIAHRLAQHVDGLVVAEIEAGMGRGHDSLLVLVTQARVWLMLAQTFMAAPSPASTETSVKVRLRPARTTRPSASSIAPAAGLKIGR